jgi:hypothetical protein
VDLLKGKKVKDCHMSSRERVCQKTYSFLRVLLDYVGCFNYPPLV